MFRINRHEKKLEPVLRQKMADLGIWEKRDLQEYIWNSFEDLSDELDEEDLVVIGKEVRPSKVIDDRIDLLAVDSDGTLVVIELKRSKNKLQLLQALGYAAMIARLTPKDVASLDGIDQRKLAAFNKQKLDDFELAEDTPFNTGQRVLLIAEDYDFEVLVAAEWLAKRDVQVKCARVTLASDENGKAEYLSFSIVFPPKELADEARKRKSIAQGVPGTWPEFLKTVDNIAEREFLIKHRSAGGESESVPRTFRFRIGGITRFRVWTRPKFANAEQKGRFAGDVEFWNNRLSDRAAVREVFASQRLRFRLFSPEDFQAFEKAIAGELDSRVWESRSSPSAELAVPGVQSA